MYCSARGKDITWIDTFGGKSIKYEDLNEQLNKFDIIINTVPVLILDKERLKLLDKDVLLIGIDFNVAQDLKIKTIWELGIPGKIAPLSSAKYIKETIYNILKRKEDNK